jgi:hypothetical protein
MMTFIVKGRESRGSLPNILQVLIVDAKLTGFSGTIKNQY